METKKYKESERLELKKSTSELKEAIISIASILNKHHCGTLCFGMSNDGVLLVDRRKSKKLINLFKRFKVEFKEIAVWTY